MKIQESLKGNNQPNNNKKKSNSLPRKNCRQRKTSLKHLQRKNRLQSRSHLTKRQLLLRKMKRMSTTRCMKSMNTMKKRKRRSKWSQSKKNQLIHSSINHGKNRLKKCQRIKLKPTSSKKSIMKRHSSLMRSQGHKWSQMILWNLQSRERLKTLKNRYHQNKNNL